MAGAAIRATYELEPHGSADALAVEESTGMVDLDGFHHVRGRVVSEGDGIAVVEFPVANWGRNVAMLVSSLVAGEAVETRTFTRCRLVGLSVPDGFLPGPAFGADATIGVGVIVKPSLGLSPDEVAAVAASAAQAGAALVKDDELLADPEWCPLGARVRAVAAALTGSPAVYCPNVTGSTSGVVERATRAVDLGATGVMVNAFAQGLDSVLALRDAELGVPIFAHRVSSGPWVRNERFGASGAVLVSLLRACGADYVIAGAYSGKLFDTDEDVDAQIAAARAPKSGIRPSVAVLGGGIGPDNAREQADRAGGAGLLMLLGAAAYRHPDGLAAAVRATTASVAS